MNESKVEIQLIHFKDPNKRGSMGSNKLYSCFLMTTCRSRLDHDIACGKPRIFLLFFLTRDHLRKRPSIELFGFIWQYIYIVSFCIIVVNSCVFIYISSSEIDILAAFYIYAESINNSIKHIILVRFKITSLSSHSI